jgi:hypothetical protein
MKSIQADKMSILKRKTTDRKELKKIILTMIKNITGFLNLIKTEQDKQKYNRSYKYFWNIKNSFL